MKRTLLLAICLPSLAALLAPADAAAQQDYPLEGTVLFSVGGSIDEDQSGLGNDGYQIGLSLGVGRRTKVGIRAGEIGYDVGDRVGPVSNPEFSYVAVGGEYTFSERYYESGIYLALGAYKLEGILDGQAFDDTTVGITLGVTGEFEITRRIGLVLEVAGHVANFEAARYFATAHGGLAYHF